MFNANTVPHIFQKLLLSVLLAAMVIPMSARAANDQQKECFAQLQKSFSEVTTFGPLHKQIQELQYTTVENGLSNYYKNISSFGIDLLSPDFDMRVYSFGRDTGYQHPPFSPFPTYSLSDKWETPAKEFIYAEEYVRNPETNERIFLSCSLMIVVTGSLKKVTAEKYLYDGPMSSVMYTAPDGSYKTWYSKNKSFDHNNVEFVTWERLFVYPKSTQNQFFDRYTVADAFPARTTDSLANIVHDPKDLKEGSKDLLTPPELRGYDTVFALNSFYQEIENAFPKFAERLSLRGILTYGTVKELLATRGVSEFGALWETVLDPREITKYALLKEKNLLVKDNGDSIKDVNEESAFLEEQLMKINTLALEQEAQYLLKTVPDRNPVSEEDVLVTPSEEKSGQSLMMIAVTAFVAVVVVMAGALFWMRKRRQGELEASVIDGQ